MKVAVYCRVSTEEQDPKKQEEELKDFCTARDWMAKSLFSL